MTITFPAHSRDGMMFRASVDHFSAWLAASGALVLDPASDYEVMRWRCRADNDRPLNNLTTVIVWRKRDGSISLSPYAAHHWNLFVAGVKMPEQPSEIKAPKKVRSWTQRTREALIERDGMDCYYCGHTMKGHDHNQRPTKDGRDDITIEHMLAQKIGRETGVDVNHLDNLTLAHAKCNRLIGHAPVSEKMIYREIIRDQKTDVEHWD